MSQELIQVQEKKRLSFEQIAKKWHYRLEHAKRSKFQLATNCMLLNAKNHCIVGEAHGGKHDYGCELCEDIGMMFFSFYTNGKMHRENEFERVKTAFIEHWNENHV